MRLAEYFTHRGNRLFKCRSVTPLLLIPLFWLERDSFYYPFDSHGWDLVWEFASLSVALRRVPVTV